MPIHIRDVLSFHGRDYWSKGRPLPPGRQDLAAGARRRRRDGAVGRAARRRRGRPADRLMVLHEVRDLEMAVPPPRVHRLSPAAATCSGWRRGRPIEVDGVVPEHTTGPLQVWRYRAAGDLYLQIEEGQRPRLHDGRRIGSPRHHRPPAGTLRTKRSIMGGNSFGTMFRVTTFGESHGPGVGVVVDGCPPRLPITVEEIQRELDRRRPGQSAITTQRREADAVEILSGVHDGLTLGTPIALLVRNQDQRSGDYEEMRTKYRPSHADYTYQAKFGVRAWEGGGRASARETIGRVAAGVLARKALAAAGAIEIVAWVQRVQDLEVEVDATHRHARGGRGQHRPLPRRRDGDQDDRAASTTRARRATRWAASSRRSRAACRPAWASRCSTSWTPIWPRRCCRCRRPRGSRSAAASPARTSPAASTTIRSTTGPARSGPARNRSGGVQGGISNGEEIVMRVAFKPTATILREQETVDENGQRHDDQGARPPRPLRAAARGADRRGDAGAGAGRSLSAPARPVRIGRLRRRAVRWWRWPSPAGLPRARGGVL